METIIYNAIGTSGVLLILIGYFLLQKGSIEGRSLSYNLLNFIGALLLLISLYHTPNIPSIIIEIAWIAISIYGIVKVLKDRKGPTKESTSDLGE